MSDKEKLKLFLHRVEDLRNTRLIQLGYDSGFTISWTEEEGGLEFNFKHPDEELFRSMLLALRHFILKKEPTYIYRIYNICYRYLTNEKHMEYLVKSRTILDQSMKSTGVHLNINERHFTPEYVWDVYINGIYFHNDEEKMGAITYLLDHERNLVKNELYGFVNSSIKQVLYVGKIVDYSFKHSEFKFWDVLL
jgi:hypothetical protein